MFEGVRTVMVFAQDPEASARWYGELLGVPVRVDAGDPGAVWVETGGVELGFHPADDARNPRGGSPVVYWSVAEVRERLLAAGFAHHRGPLTVGPGRRIAQLRDPFGTIIGIEGP